MEYTSSASNNDFENILLKSELDLKSKDQCNNFKSSYARSLSFNKNKAKSLNLSVNQKSLEVNCESSVYIELDNDKYKSVNVIDDTKTQQKKNQVLIDEIRQLNQRGATDSSYFDSVLLQTQVNTLQWQLKQVESTRQMYQTVLEEVVRFLKKCYQHLNMLMEPWPRSKSEKHIVNNDDNENISKLEPMRAQSTINLHNMTCLLEREFHKVPRAGNNNNNKLNLNLDTEKISNEAFRLYRTTENLINMQGPNLIPMLKNNEDLTEFKTNDIIPQSNKIFDTFLNDAAISSIDLQEHKHKNNDSVSFRTYTNGSIHSNSSKSSITTDEDMINTSKISSVTPTFGTSKQLNPTRNKSLHTTLSNCIDVESGFSSMNSFQEIGLPIVNTAQILMTPNFNSFSISNKESNDKLVKTELQTNCKIQRKWSSLPMSSKKTPAPLFEFKCDETLKVLWV